MRLLIILFALALSACATSPQPVTPRAATGGFQAFGTLASSDDQIALQASSIYTSLARLNFNAETRFKDGRITVSQAKQIRAAFKSIAADLDVAVLGRDSDAIERAARRAKVADDKLEAWQ